MRNCHMLIVYILIGSLLLCSCGSGSDTAALTEDAVIVTYSTSETDAAESETGQADSEADTDGSGNDPADSNSSETGTPDDVSPDGPVIEIGGRIIEGGNAPSELVEAVRPTVEAALNEYALFFIYKGFDLDSYVDPASDLYGYLFGNDHYNRIYNEYYNYEYIDSWDYSLFETSDYMLFSQAADPDQAAVSSGDGSTDSVSPSVSGDMETSQYLTVNVRYKLDIAFTRQDMEDENQKLDALWTFRNTDGGWKLYDISNNGQTFPDPAAAIDGLTGDDPDGTAAITDLEGVCITDIRGKDFDGVLMIIEDPSRVFVGTVPYFAYDYGQTVPEMIGSYENNGYELAGGINGGNFDDSGTGSSYTAMPKGIVISEGELVFAEYLPESSGAAYDGDTVYHLTGLNEDGKLILGNMTAEEALNLGIRDAVYTTEKEGPFLIIDGQIQYDQLTDPSVYGAGKNPRTAIGQRADGSLIMLVINGRQPSSLGASFEDLADIMLECGAVTASAMDGGTSSQMIWEEEILNQPFSAFGLRMCPTAWLIRS